MRSEIITHDELTKISRYLQPDNKLALDTAAITGLRIGDVLNLRDTNLIDNYIVFVAQKTGKPGKSRVPAALMRKLRANIRNGFVFPGRSGTKPRTRQAVFADMRKACKIAKIPHHVSPHSTRKLFAVDTVNRKGLNAAMVALQHSSPAMTRIYITDNTDAEPPAWAYTIADYIINKVTKNVEHLLKGLK